jgi:hypothetical protein
MKNIIISGCSYSTNTGTLPYGAIIGKQIPSVPVDNKAWPGQSNKSILSSIRTSIKDGATDTLFICQLTHLHRLNLYCTLNDRYIDFQPLLVKPIPQIKDGNIEFEIDTKSKIAGRVRGIGTYGAAKQVDANLPEDIFPELFDFYEQYLKYFYDDNESFNSLMDDVDDIQRLVDTTNNKILFLYWPHILPNKDELKKRNFINFNKNYSMLEWSTKNNLLDGISSHLNTEGHTKVAENILNVLDIKKNRII